MQKNTEIANFYDTFFYSLRSACRNFFWEREILIIFISKVDVLQYPAKQKDRKIFTFLTKYQHILSNFS